ncbi:hypothetical protein K492DRAFT_205723 [Lichtheimia hyalospora FSU 10163]|nr:hypothetical protein K492DRAFT_205723 [Lichtheimia hyalospora FSU 10163]
MGITLSLGHERYESYMQRMGNTRQMFLASITLKNHSIPAKWCIPERPNVDMKEIYELQVSLKEHIKDFLKDQSLFPRELIFISRNMNIIRANNKSIGSPVNRINVMAQWALYGLARSKQDIDYTEIPIRPRIEDYARTTWNLCRFESTLFAMTMNLIGF